MTRLSSSKTKLMVHFLWQNRRCSSSATVAKTLLLLLKKCRLSLVISAFSEKSGRWTTHPIFSLLHTSLFSASVRIVSIDRNNERTHRCQISHVQMPYYPFRISFTVANRLSVAPAVLDVYLFHSPQKVCPRCHRQRH